MSMIIPTHTSSSSSCSYSSHSTIDTSSFKDTQICKSKQDLWHIIEKQRAIIQELQQALVDVTSERDGLLLKAKSIPTPPPRSPYRSHNHGETPENNYTQKRKSIPTTTFTTAPQSKAHIKVKSVHSNRFSLAVMDHVNLELWAIEKTFTELIHLNHTLHKKLNLSFHLALDSVDRKQLKTMMEDFFKRALQCQSDLSPVYSFISVKSAKHQQQQQGYLSKRGKHIIGGWKSYYFILFESELRYFSTHKGDLHVRCIPLNHDTQIGKQADGNVEPFEHAFVIVHEAAPIILGAASDTERDDWVQALLMATKKRRTQQQPITRHHSESTAVPARSSSNNNHLHHHKSMYIEHSMLLQDNTRSSMDDQTILNYYESVHQPHQQTQQRTVVLKASADSLPLDLQSDEKSKKHRKSFWSRRKFFSNSNTMPSASPTSTTTSPTSAALPIVDTASIRHTLSFPFINNTEETSSSGSSACSTPMFQIFGVPLEAAIRVSRISERYQLPAIVYRCIAYLEEKKAIHEEGIYRLSGSSAQMSYLRQQFCEYGDVDLLDKKYADVDVHVVAGLLKAWLRELPINVLTHELLNDFLLICDIKDKQSKIQELGLLVSILPLANYTLLRTLIAHLIHIVHNADTNKMTLRNVSIVFAPTLSIPSGIFTLLMSEFEYIFYTKEQQETAVPEATTSADRIKNNYLKKRSNRNSSDYKDQVPPNIIRLEKEYRHDSLVIEQDELDGNCNKQMT
ncbi:Respiratory supercomplex factor 1, mitochondrial [Mucor velutinosus]|uniref:Respiratory supercomplex factor 1, mitochondrial n=1 Tax=Mucor velutinosus TaxID=708070 RepID=A0AAN7HVQ9_9FUNG|nr:Respiratory supercomplex factor 1, mitochondrial [Mucor velutinosus]